jgi:hypothetical protein
LGDLQESLHDWVDELADSLIFIGVEFVFDHERNKDTEDPSVEIVTEAHGSTSYVPVFGLLLGEGKTDLFVYLWDNDLLGRQSKYSFLLGITGFTVPVELPASHDNPTLMHISL